MDFEQSTSQVLPPEDMSSHGYGTWPAAMCMHTPQIEYQLNGSVMGPESEVVEPIAHFQYAWSYQHIDYEQSTPQTWPTEEISSQYNGTWPAGTWVPTLHGGNPFCVDSAGQMPPGYLQYPQLEWMNTYQW